MSEIQKELNEIFKEQGLFEAIDKRYAAKVVERIVFGILGLFGVAIVMKLIQSIGL